MFHSLVGGQRFSANITDGGQKNVAHPTSIGIYTSPTAPSPKGEGGDEGGCKCLILLSSAIAPALLYLLHPCSRHPSPLQQERELGASATHCFYYAEKLWRYLCPTRLLLITNYVFIH